MTALSPAYITLSGPASGALQVDATSQHAYLAGGAQVFQFAIASDGTLSPLTPVAATPTAVGVTLTPDGQSA